MTLLDEVHLFLEATGIGRSEFGRAITGNTGMLKAWENGKRYIGPQLVDRIRNYMLDNCDRCETARPKKAAPPTEKIIDLSTDPDSWPGQAREASKQMVAALRRNHPEKCVPPPQSPRHFEGSPR